MDTQNQSYSIYIDRRPIRSLYIFNQSSLDFGQIDAVIEYNRKKWGGRYNMILTKRGREISDNQWKFLKQYDPDFINLTIPITKRLATDLDTRITPLQVTKGISRNVFSPRIDEEGISIYPTAQTIRQVSNAFGSEVYYVIFDIDDCNDENIKNFIRRNFGTTDLRDMSNNGIKGYPFNLPLKITDKASFITALTSFSDFKPYVFPIQLCSIGDYIGDDRSHDVEEAFYVFVGDSPMDLVDFWNNPLYIQSWTRTRLRQIWIPSVLAEDPELKDAFQKFIKGRADPYGHGKKIAVFSTRSLSEVKLNEIATNLTQNTWLRKQAGVKQDTSYPDYGDYFSFDRTKLEMVHFRGSGEKEKIIVPPPDVQEGVMDGEHWMSDLYIQIPEKKVVPVNFETWLQLPKNNSVAHTVINSGPARITQVGLPSVLSARSNQFNPSTQDIEITIPKTWNIFESMILNAGKPYYTSDLRSSYIKPYRYTIDVSSAGMHIHGFLGVFGDLESANQVFEKRYWRLFFDLIANVTQEKEEKRLNYIKAKLTKQIARISDPASLSGGRFVDWLSNKLQDAARTYLEERPKAVSFNELEKIVRSELTEYNSKNPGNKFRFSEKATIEGLKNLTDSQVILIGYELKCPNCLNKEWRALNEINQITTCRGCGYDYPFPPETKIVYKLNSLVETGIRSKGVVPVVLGLGTIFREARSYFDFLPPVDIFKKGKHITDLDICCIIDGKFIIGEVKANCSLFDLPDDFETIAMLAKEIHPDKVVFCSLVENPPQRIKDEINKISAELAPFGVTVEWLKFDPWVFDAEPLS